MISGGIRVSTKNLLHFYRALIVRKDNKPATLIKSILIPVAVFTSFVDKSSDISGFSLTYEV